MSTDFRSCPGCDSFILADTFECPECGHVFDEARASANRLSKEEELKNQKMYDTCRQCGESVRSGLVRCWNCNAFMRKDVEARYREMQATPQPIIFSDIPKEQRTEVIPTGPMEGGTGYGANVFDADESDFALDDSVMASADTLDAEAPAAPPENQSPTEKQPSAEQKPVTAEQPATSAPAEESPKNDKANSDKAKKPVDKDDIFGLAMLDQRETRRKKKDRIAQSRAKKVLLPCTACGSWIRVHQELGGKVVRCGQCKSRVVVPIMKKKEKAAEAKVETGPKVSVDWLEDVRLHVVSPTDVTLKPGSLEKGAEPADLGFHESGMYLVKLAAPAKKSLFGKSGDGPPEHPEQRRQIREQIAKSGEFDEIPFGQIHAVKKEKISSLKLIQPVADASQSMFAGVPVFGEGQIAVYLPITLEEGKQAMLSFSLSSYRKFAEHLKNALDADVGATENGVPAEDEYESLTCSISDQKFDSLKDVLYYEKDPAYELEVAGYICATCGVAIGEEGRARKKLGGANGKGIAKAKCPKCSNKLGDQKAWKIAKGPDEDEAQEEEEDVSEVLKPKAAKAASENTAESNGVSLETLKGTWKMVSLGQNGDFEKLQDMAAADILLTIDGDKYTVSAGGKNQEEGTLKVDAGQTPVHLDQTLTSGDDSGKTHLGLVRLVDGRLENCQAAFDQPRPAGFESQKDSTASLAVFERAK